MLAHFKPFSAEKPLVNSGETIEDAFKNHCFDQFSRNIMANWEAIHECEDARDAEHIRKRALMTKSSHVMQQTFQSVLEDDWEIDIEKSSQQNSTKDLQLMMRLQLLEYSNWFSELQTHPHIIHAKSTQPDLIPDITSLHIKQWKAEIKLQEKVIAQSRINILNPEQEAHKPKLSTLTTTQIQKKLHLKLENKAQLNTVSPTFEAIITEITPEELCTQISKKFQLNKKQKISFLIASIVWL